MNLSEMYRAIIEHNIATKEEVDLVLDVAGCNEDIFDCIVYSREGYQSLEDYLKDIEGGE